MVVTEVKSTGKAQFIITGTAQEVLDYIAEMGVPKSCVIGFTAISTSSFAILIMK